MKNPLRHTKIVATLGPASRSPELIRQLIRAGMDVARLNFSHGSYDDHASTIAHLRAMSRETDMPVTIMQDLQGPKVRVGQLPGGGIELQAGQEVSLAPEEEAEAGMIPLDYPHAAEEAREGMQVLLADGLLELQVVQVQGRQLRCRVVEGGMLGSRKGVNFPNLKLRLPSLTEKDRQDVEFGLEQGVDWISLSFVRTADDVRTLKQLLAEKGARKPVLAKIEKPQAVEEIEAILEEVDGVMVARGDLGVEMSPEKVPMLQKRIIELCNRRSLPVITATQMLESMIREPRPTRAEASDVANAIIDGTDAVMLSGETAVGAYPVRAVEMMARIAHDVEARIQFKQYPAGGTTSAHALSEAANVIGKSLEPKCIVIFTTSGHTARFVAAERSKTPVLALTADLSVYHRLNLLWGIRPLLARQSPHTFEELVALAEQTLRERQIAAAGDRIVVMGGIPTGRPGGVNFIKIHTLE